MKLLHDIVILQPSSPGKKSKLDEKSPKKSKDLTGKLKEAITPMVQLNKQLKAKTVPPVIIVADLLTYFKQKGFCP